MMQWTSVSNHVLFIVIDFLYTFKSLAFCVSLSCFPLRVYLSCVLIFALRCLSACSKFPTKQNNWYKIDLVCKKIPRFFRKGEKSRQIHFDSEFAPTPLPPKKKERKKNICLSPSLAHSETLNKTQRSSVPLPVVGLNTKTGLKLGRTSLLVVMCILHGMPFPPPFFLSTRKRERWRKGETKDVEINRER